MEPTDLVASAATNIVHLDSWRRLKGETGVPAQSEVAEPASDDGWHDGVHRRILELISLPMGWDGYNGLPVEKLTALFALRMLYDLKLDKFAPNPQIVPGVDGDLQFEWHAMSGSIELHVLRPYEVVAWRQLPGTASEDVELKADFSPIAHWFDILIGDDRIAADAAAG